MSHSISRRAAGAATLALSAALVLAACGEDGAPAEGDAPAEEPAAQEQGGGDWPRTVSLGDQEVEIPEPPERVVAMSVETSDIALELAGPERLAAIAPGSATEGGGNVPELGEQVEQTLPSGITPEPEQILSWEPDLVLMTGRHDDEHAAADVLRSAGVPTLVFEGTDFSDPRAVSDSVRILGAALGAEAEAEERATALDAQVAQVEDAVAAAEETPRVLGLMARGDQVMITGLGSTLTTLTELAGGQPVAAEQQWHGTVPADPELVLAAEPEVILVEDFRGAGLGPFQSLLGAEALAGVPAIAEDEVHTIADTLVSGSAGLYLGDGLEEVARALHPELF